jgi:hypothetical protein
MKPPDSNSPDQRRRAVAWAIALTSGTPLAPQRYERYLLALYQRGLLTIEEVMELLNCSIYQVLYHSRATAPPSPAELQALLNWSRRYNAARHITGVLLYSEGRYVQVLEGREADIRALYARIQADTRHEQVVTVCEGPAPQRRFADWCMGFGHVASSAVDQVLDVLQAQTPARDLPVDDPHLRALLDAFGAHPFAAEVAPA